ncbi:MULTISPECIES: nucleoside-diphosphate sugar epimerase/dehydratase [unclassified Pseudomonas]|uniref:polysaccharide biosynthesis protein n=1 Tax=unclassified Pseudomonas TaxID=196821 RepID=UPI00128BAF32|nr:MULTISPECIES: nucleoside-diphosphate sugar epimerase/dehydratase [unclassified Pseudomonas]MPQ71302.1 NAD-dependent epimerase/dehydratase family protein [Pseudomonas sp. MWU12-2323]
MRERLLGLPRSYKRILQLLVDIVLVWAALWLAFVVRLGIEQPVDPFGDYAWLFVAAPAITVPIFIHLGLYRAVMRYFGNDALISIFKAVTLSALLLTVYVYLYRPSVLVPRSLIINYWWLSLLMVGGLRLFMRQYFLGDWFLAGQHVPFLRQDDDAVKVAVYGGGAAGNQLVAALRMGKAMRPVAFIDDDASIANRAIAGLRVYPFADIERLIEDTGATEVLLAIPSASRVRRREILTALESYPVHVRTIPGFMDLASGRVSVSDLQEVDIIDLLGRDTVAAQQTLFERCIRGHVVMVTGAGGSIGSELCRQIFTSKPTALVLFEHSEFNLYSIQSELEKLIHSEGLNLELVPILGSIRNSERLLDVMRTWNVKTVYHAAAYKHVPIVEHNVAEGVLNNVLGTLQTAQAAVQAGVEHFVLISTDKAVRPTNVMGCTKRLAEMTLQALSRESQPLLLGERFTAPCANTTRFTMVRFGNVLGSSGSVIPLFREQIKSGGPITVTHPHMTRYFMTIPEAAQLVIQAGSMGQGGDVFVLDMGQPVKIADLAEKMIHLSGLSVRSKERPNGDVAIEFTGLRRGEKLYEELLIGDDVRPTEHPMIMRSNEEHLPWEDFKVAISALLKAVAEDDYGRVRTLLSDTVTGYAPECQIVDLIHQRRQVSGCSGDV